MKKQQVITADGSHSIFLEEINEHYHSTHGAITESMHVFGEHGLIAKSKEQQSIVVFEVGMGTGLNVLMSQLLAQKWGIRLEMHTIEAFPLNWEEVKRLNYEQELKSSDHFLKAIHTVEWGKKIKLSQWVELMKHYGDIQTYDITHLPQFDVVYFDAFAPEKQAEMWTAEVFQKLFRQMSPGGLLVTYCVKGEIRRRLSGIGFEVEKLKGPKGGKREMLRAKKPFSTYNSTE